MNVVLMSPNFPPSYYQFAVGLKRAGATVLAVGDAPYETLRPELRNALTEYYRVDSLHDYAQLLRACAFFTYRYGKLDRLESHNEFWLETDARLRLDFNIPGLKPVDMEPIKRKSKMKEVFQAGGVDVARGTIVRTRAEAKAFISDVGYPVIAKPDIGVGASATYKIASDRDLERYFAERPVVDYVMEEFITGQLCSFDGLTDQNGEIVFCTGHFYKSGIMEVVNNYLDVYACSYRKLPSGLDAAGRRAVRAFDVRERFFHVEFFRQAETDRWVVVEMNMRPPGGVMLDVINYANDVDLFEQWGNIVVHNAFTAEYSRPYHCAFVARRNQIRYVHSHEDVLAVCAPAMAHHEPISPVFARAMGDYAYLVRSPDFDTLMSAIEYIHEV
ncbi:MAG: acetyl-CoA carboxylase biotin carboxylase subunit family protein [Anaerolineae bacterium]